MIVPIKICVWKLSLMQETLGDDLQRFKKVELHSMLYVNAETWFRTSLREE